MEEINKNQINLDPEDLLRAKVFQKLLQVQTELKCPKNQVAKTKTGFERYKYRNCEDILEAVKPLLAKVKATIILTDCVNNIGTRFYVRATAAFVDTETGAEISNFAYAREEETREFMDGSQITGAASSYARKYALNGLLAIDDMRDNDAINDSQQKNNNKASKQELASKEQLTEIQNLFAPERITELLKYYKIDKLEKLPAKDAADIIARRKKEPAANNGGDNGQK